DERRNVFVHTRLDGGGERVHRTRVVEAQDSDGAMALELHGFRHGWLLFSGSSPSIGHEEVAPVLVCHLPAGSHHVAVDHLPQQALIWWRVGDEAPPIAQASE